MLIYDEQVLATNFYKHGFSNGYGYYEAILVTKYFRHILGYKDQTTKTKLIEYCQKWDKNFRYVPKRDSIRGVLRESRTDFRKTKDSVILWKEEIKKIKEIKNFKYQRILLCLVMIAKIKNKAYVKINDWKYVRKIISKNISNHIIMEAIREAYQKGLINEPRYDSHEFSFLLESGDAGIFINGEKEAYNLNNAYQSYCGGVLGYCRDCGCEFVKETRNQGLCTNHQIERKRKKYNRYNNKRKQKSFV